MVGAPALSYARPVMIPRRHGDVATGNRLFQSVVPVLASLTCGFRVACGCEERRSRP